MITEKKSIHKTGKIKSNFILYNTMFILCIVGFSLLFEVFVLNFDYWTLKNKEKGYHSMMQSDISTKNIRIEGDSVVILNDDNYFKVNNDIFIRYLTLSFSQIDYNALSISANTSEISDEGSKEYIGRYENFISVRTHSDSSDFFYHIKSQSGEYPITFKLQDISVDNRLYPNLLRIMLILITLLIVYFFVVFRKIAFQKMHITFLVISIFIGSIFVIFIPYGYSWDETEHFYKAYNVASGNVDVIDKPQVEITEKIGEFTTREPSTTFRQKVAQLKLFSDSNEKTNYYLASTARGYTSVPYLGAAVGIIISKMFGAPFIYQFYIGRFFSLLLYSVIGYFSIKDIKIGKNIVFCILLFPVNLFLASSYSADPTTTAMAVLGITFFVNIIHQENKRVVWKNIIPFIATVVMLTACKPTYAPFILLVLAIPKVKFDNPRYQFVKKLLVIAGVLMIGVILYLYSERFHELAWPVPGADVNGQLNYIIHNPIEYVMNFIKFLITNANFYLQSTIINIAYAGNICTIWNVVIPIMLVYIALLDEEIHVQINNWSRVVMIFIFLCTFGLVYTALYLSFTPVGNTFASGVQPRYLIPLYTLLFMCLKNNTIKLVHKDKTKIRINVIVAFVMTASLLNVAIHMLLQYYL